MMRVGQDVPVQYLDHNAIPVVGEFPVCRLFGLRITNGSQQDEVVVGVSALAIRRYPVLPSIGRTWRTGTERPRRRRTGAVFPLLRSAVTRRSKSVASPLVLADGLT